MNLHRDLDRTGITWIVQLKFDPHEIEGFRDVDPATICDYEDENSDGGYTYSEWIGCVRSKDLLNYQCFRQYVLDHGILLTDLSQHAWEKMLIECLAKSTKARVKVKGA